LGARAGPPARAAWTAAGQNAPTPAASAAQLNRNVWRVFSNPKDSAQVPHYSAAPEATPG
jgi:hypothetical protein